MDFARTPSVDGQRYASCAGGKREPTLESPQPPHPYRGPKDPQQQRGRAKLLRIMHGQGEIKNKNMGGLFVDRLHPQQRDLVVVWLEFCHRTAERVDPNVVLGAGLGRILGPDFIFNCGH